MARLIRGLLVTALVTTLAAGLAWAQTPRRGGVLRVGLNADPPNMDPHSARAGNPRDSRSR